MTGGERRFQPTVSNKDDHPNEHPLPYRDRRFRRPGFAQPRARAFLRRRQNGQGRDEEGRFHVQGCHEEGRWHDEEGRDDEEQRRVRRHEEGRRHEEELTLRQLSRAGPPLPCGGPVHFGATSFFCRAPCERRSAHRAWLFARPRPRPDARLPLASPARSAPLPPQRLPPHAASFRPCRPRGPPWPWRGWRRSRLARPRAPSRRDRPQPHGREICPISFAVPPPRLSDGRRNWVL